MATPNRVVDLRRDRPMPVSRRSEPRPAPKRQSALKARKKRNRAIISAAVCVFLMGFAYAIHLASYLPQFTYSDVTVNGTSVLLPEDVKAFALQYLKDGAQGYLSGSDIFVFKPTGLENAIAAHFRRAKSVRVTPQTFFSNALSVAIEERQSYGQWCDTDLTCFLLDENGLVFSSLEGQATSTFVTPYVFEGSLATTTNSFATLLPIGGTFAAGHFPGVLSLLQVLGQNGFPAFGASMSNGQDISVPLTLGFYIKASFGEDPQLLAKNLKLVLSADALKDKADQLEYVDLRFGNRVYYKLKGALEAGGPQ